MKKIIIWSVAICVAISLFVAFDKAHKHKKEKANQAEKVTYYPTPSYEINPSKTFETPPIGNTTSSISDPNEPRLVKSDFVDTDGDGVRDTYSIIGTSLMSKSNEPRLVKSDFVDSDGDGLKDTYTIIGMKPSAEEQPEETERNLLSNSNKSSKTYRDYGSRDYVPPDILSTIIHVNSEESDYILKKLPGIGVKRVILLKERRPFYSVEEVMAAKIGVGPKYGAMWKEGVIRGAIVFD